MRLKAVQQQTGLARATLYKYISENRFPKPVSLGGRCVAWVASDVSAWIEERIRESRQTA